MSFIFTLHKLVGPPVSYYVNCLEFALCYRSQWPFNTAITHRIKVPTVISSSFCPPCSPRTSRGAVRSLVPAGCLHCHSWQTSEVLHARSRAPRSGSYLTTGHSNAACSLEMSGSFSPPQSPIQQEAFRKCVLWCHRRQVLGWKRLMLSLLRYLLRCLLLKQIWKQASFVLPMAGRKWKRLRSQAWNQAAGEMDGPGGNPLQQVQRQVRCLVVWNTSVWNNHLWEDALCW